ncbi:hypothetical protein GMDG_03813 [Pseudogymnoascus destructans 20631-21]|uniref:Uncharacterized protein n=1 Tax=Pseudogymnoascus destructans (strain ATCC MYA-4855 / 20631-21) TaxID=658429 RepID=L8G7N3_PSED2|nr:hypothetical protein GMDG_03813 [Pseudogymnoascus destructans 20631-21]
MARHCCGIGARDPPSSLFRRTDGGEMGMKRQRENQSCSGEEIRLDYGSVGGGRAGKRQCRVVMAARGMKTYKTTVNLPNILNEGVIRADERCQRDFWENEAYLRNRDVEYAKR